ncbi:MAG: hypothetical protein ABIO70_30885 [Pseudomonadota bacterium]
MARLAALGPGRLQLRVELGPLGGLDRREVVLLRHGLLAGVLDLLGGGTLAVLLHRLLAGLLVHVGALDLALLGHGVAGGLNRGVLLNEVQHLVELLLAGDGVQAADVLGEGGDEGVHRAVVAGL